MILLPKSIVSQSIVEAFSQSKNFVKVLCHCNSNAYAFLQELPIFGRCHSEFNLKDTKTFHLHCVKFVLRYLILTFCMLHCKGHHFNDFELNLLTMLWLCTDNTFLQEKGMLKQLPHRDNPTKLRRLSQPTKLNNATNVATFVQATTHRKIHCLAKSF